MKLSRAIACALGVWAAVSATAAIAAPEEVQVYMDEHNKPGEIGLDVHNSYVFSGDATPAYAGEQPGVHRYRITPEFALGLTDSLELGAYLPLATIGNDGVMRADGVKFRIKYIAPRKDSQKWFWGANFEIGRVAHRLDENPWNAEFKGIGGIHAGKWTAALNANIDFKISGPAPAPASLELASKLNYALTPRLRVGVENYTGMGEFRHLGRFGSSEQASYATLDTLVGKWDLNFGIGRGYGANADKWIAKFIIGVPL